MSTCHKITYKPKYSYIKYKSTPQQNSIENTVLTPLTHLLSSSPSSQMQNHYITLYNSIFHLFKSENNFQSTITLIYSHIIEPLITSINTQLNNATTPQDKLHLIFNFITTLNTSTSTIKTLLTTNSFRYNISNIKHFNTHLNSLSLINHFQSTHQHLYEETFTYLTSLPSNDLVLSYLPYITNTSFPFLKKLSSYISNNLISKYTSSLASSNQIDNVVDYLNNYFTLIDNDISLLFKLFGKQEANAIKDKLIEMVLTNIINDNNNIFANKNIIEQLLINDKEYSKLKLINKIISRNKMIIMKTFYIRCFDMYYKYYLSTLNTNINMSLIKNRINYIKHLLFHVEQVIYLYKEVFNTPRFVHLNYYETILKIINVKHNCPFESMLCAFIHYAIIEKDDTRLYGNAIKIVLLHLNEKEFFIQNMMRYLLKRISLFKFDIEYETKFELFIRNEIGMRYMVKYSRIINDIKESLLQLNVKDIINFYLLSYDSLNQNDLMQVINVDNQDINFNECIMKYNQLYPKRKIMLSQILTTAEIEFKFGNTCNDVVVIIVNYIQALILMIFNNKIKLTYKDIITHLGNSKHYSLIRKSIFALMECNIIIKADNNNNTNTELLNEDVLTINMGVTPSQIYSNCHEKFNKLLSKELYNGNNTVNDTESSHIDNDTLIERNIYTINKKFIIQSKLIRIIKQSHPQSISETDLIRILVRDNIIQQIFKENVDIAYIKSLIDILLQKEYIILLNKNNSIYYKYK
jgi:hypothetical protein